MGLPWLLDNTAYPFETLQNIPEGHFHVRGALRIRAFWAG